MSGVLRFVELSRCLRAPRLHRCSQSPCLLVSLVSLSPSGLSRGSLDARARLLAGSLGRALEAPAQHLLDRGHVVGALDGLDLELAVAALLRLAVLEHHHRADRVGALGVRDIVALDPRRQPRQPQQVAHLGQPGDGALLAVEPLQPDLLQLLARVLGRQLDQLALLAAPRHLDLDLVAALLAQPLLDDQRLLDMIGQQDVRRHLGGAVVELGQERGQQMLVVLVLGVLERERLRADQLAAADVEDLHHRRAILAREGDHILVGVDGAQHLLALADLLDVADLVAQVGRALELHILGGPLHLAAQVAHDLVGLALQEAADRLDRRAVLLARDQRPARTAPGSDGCRSTCRACRACGGG